MTNSTVAANMVFTVLPFAEEYQMIDTGLGEVTVRQDCDEARPKGRPGF